ncbi:hypothetical protein RD1_3859 [Roseobacter denitrificans OCh 114]|uniref:Uncharacterized protein n=1 Tax=Roseobacter denitrificans (strain ATCC 33942 / OCh 114) TaxID=375451 RepID=Q161M2_ROSDO|nr:hypothetical protein RD1_3859 [Roseobacter denitrificans OCh 114]
MMGAIDRPRVLWTNAVMGFAHCARGAQNSRAAEDRATQAVMQRKRLRIC